MPMAADVIVVQAPDCLAADLPSDELVLMSVRRGRYVSLNSMGKEIWSRISQPRSLGDLCAELAQFYDAPAGLIEADVREFIEGMMDTGMVSAGARP